MTQRTWAKLALLVLDLFVATEIPRAATVHSVTLTWTLPPFYTGVLIYRSNSLNGTYGQITKTVGNVTTYVDVSVLANRTYYYKAKTYCDNCKPKDSVYSNVVTATIP